MSQIMAQEFFFKVDVLLRFKPQPRVWIGSGATVKGWVDDEVCDKIQFSAPIGTTRYVSSGELDPWRMTLPPELKELLEYGRALPQSEELRESFSDFKVPCVVQFEPGSGVEQALAGKDPLVELLRARSTAVETQQQIRSASGNSCPKEPEKDPWEMRREFFKCKPTTEDFVRFLNRWGRWDYSDGAIPLYQLVEYQKECMQALTQAPELWLKESGFFFLQRMTRAPYFALDIDDCRRAIAAAITIDLLREIEFKLCARKDCGVPFEIRSKHERMYCTQRCAHLESVRKSRREAKSAKGGQ